MTSPFSPCARVVSAEEMRALDRAAIEDHGIPSLTLMENAAAAVARAAAGLCRSGGAVVAVCGPGNNGGDGLAAVRILLGQGIASRALVLVDGFEGDARVQLESLRRIGGRVDRFTGEVPAGAGDVVLDAIFGTGLTRPPSGEFAAAIEAIRAARAAGARVVAVDIPSGLSSDTGRPLGPCAQSDRTVTFGYRKRGQVVQPGASLCGEITVEDIGIPRAAEACLVGPPLHLLDAAAVRSWLPARPPEAHKGTFGHLLAVAGSDDKTGAAAMLCLGALRGGVGLCTVAARRQVAERVVAAVPEVMAAPLEGEGPLGLADLRAIADAARAKTAVAIGPGIAVGPETGALVADLLSGDVVPGPFVVDADGLNALASGPRLERLRRPAAPRVFTPHPGEMARLIGGTTESVQADRVGAARRFAAEHHAVVVLKGAGTVVACPDGVAALNPTGNAGLATAGTGDVLCGLLGGLLAQRVAPALAAAAAVYVHGLAGDRVAERRGMTGLIATDLLDGLGEVWAAWGV